MSTSATTFEENNINHIGIDPEEPEVSLGDYDPHAAERKFPADPRPGTHSFTFALQTGEGYEKQPFELVEKKKDGVVVGKTLLVNYKLLYEVELPSGDKKERTLNFQRFDFWQTPGMKEKGVVSEGARLLSALGYNAATNGPMTESNVKAFLTSVDGRVKVNAATGIRYWDKEAKVETTTHPRKGGSAQQWPRTADGTFEKFITNSGGDSVPGNAFVVSFYKPKN